MNNLLQKIFKPLLKKNLGHNAIMLQQSGLEAINLGYYDKAIVDFKKALALDPTLTVTSLELANAYRLTNQSNLSLEVLNNLLKLNLSNEHSKVAQNYLAYLQKDLGNYSKALEHAKNAENLQLVSVLAGTLNVYKNNYRPTFSKNLYSKTTKLDKISKILYFAEISLPHKNTGYCYRTHYLAKSLISHGKEVLVVTRPGFGINSDNKTEKYDGVQYARIVIPGSTNYNDHPLDQYLQIYLEQAEQIAKDFAPDVIHAASNFKNGFIGYELAKNLGIKFFYELRGLWEDSQIAKGASSLESERYYYFKNLENECLQKADQVITISNELKNEIASRNISKDKISIVPNAVDLEKFFPSEKEINLLEKHNLRNKIVLGYISSLNKYEGIDLLINSFKLLKNDFKNVKLLIVGDGEDKKRLENIANNDPDIVFTGFVSHSEIKNYYNAIDLFVVPRLPERVCEIVTPLKPFEAMACGCVVIASGLKCFKEIIIENETGLFFTPLEINSLVEKCKFAINNPQLREKISRNAINWISKNRTWDKVTETLLTTYESTLLPKQ